MKTPSTLLSLWEMLTFNARSFVVLQDRLTSLIVAINSHTHYKQQTGHFAIRQKHTEEIKRDAVLCLAECKKLGLRMTGASIERIIETIATGIEKYGTQWTKARRLSTRRCARS